MTIEYRSGRLNVVEDAFNMKEQLAAIKEEGNCAEWSRSQVHMSDDIWSRLCASVETDTQANRIVNQVVKPQNYFFWAPFITQSIYFLSS